MAVLALVAVLAAPHTGFAYGRAGGNILPFAITVATTGVVRSTGPAPEHVGRVTKDQLANLNRIAFETQFPTLPARTACAGALPDVSDAFIRVGTRTVRVHGSCVPRFNRLWSALVRATT
jgi:hypothetical protein